MQADKLTKLIQAANVSVEPFWPGLFAKALEGRNIGDLICNVGSAPSAAPAGGAAAGGAAEESKEEKKEEKKPESEEESDDDMGFGECSYDAPMLIHWNILMMDTWETYAFVHGREVSSVWRYAVFWDEKYLSVVQRCPLYTGSSVH